MSRTAAILKTEARTAIVPTHMIAIADLYLASEAPKGIELQVRDSGRGSPLTDEELKASIYNNGIIHPLIWKEHAGKHYVVAGNRRLRFLREIFADALDTKVRTENVADYPGDWRDVAMDTNLALPPHVVERYEMIARIAKEEKLPEAEVCKRYGMSDAQYRRVMALGKMAPIVRQAWKDAKIDAKTAQAFTLEPDPAEQAKIFATLEKNNKHVTDWMVRGRIVPPSQQEIGKLVAFVGLDKVRKARLLKQEDLFGSTHIVSDVKGLKKLVGDRLAKVRDELVQAGWSWALPSDQLGAHEYQFGDVYPDPKKVKATPEEKKRSDEIASLLAGEIEGEEEDALIEEQERIEQTIACRGFSADQMKRSGCILRVGHNGQLYITYGKVKPADKAKTSAAERREKTPAKPKKKAKPGEVSLTNALAERMSSQLEKALSAAIPAAPYVAVASIIAGFASSGHIVNVDVGKRDGRSYFHGAAADKQFLQIFNGAVKASPQEQVVMLAKVAAEALDIQVHSAEAQQPHQNPALQALAAALPKTIVTKMITDHFDAADYFSGIGLPAIVDAVRCAMDADHAAKVAKMKKGDAAKFAAAHLKNLGYLPPALRTAHYEGPVEKAEKTAPTKKTAKKSSKRKARK